MIMDREKHQDFIMSAIKKITVSSVGNIIEVTMDENEQITDITIKEDAFVKEQKPLIEELIISTVNTAKEKIYEMNASSAGKKDHFNDNSFPTPDGEQMEKIMKDMKSKISVEYKDGKPVLSVAIDSIDPNMMQNILNIFNKK